MAKKKFIVVPRTPEASINGIKTSKGTLDFKTQGPTYVDEGTASEINTQHGLKGSGDVWVEQDENLEWHEHHDGETDGRNRKGVHHYTFSGVDMSGIRNRNKSKYVWVRRGDRQVRVLREEAVENGETPIETRRRRRSAEDE